MEKLFFFVIILVGLLLMSLSVPWKPNARSELVWEDGSIERWNFSQFTVLSVGIRDTLSNVTERRNNTPGVANLNTKRVSSRINREAMHVTARYELGL